MPKVLVLLDDPTGDTAALADAIAVGARSVRFTEVDVRRLRAIPQAPDADARAGRHRTLEDVERLADYDALVLGAPEDEVARLVHQAGPLAARGALVDKVGAAFAARTPEDGERALWSILGPLARLGMLLVPPGPDAGAASPLGVVADGRGTPTEAELAAARALGRRVATVAAWVRHVKGHEAGHGAGHHHHHH